MARRVEDVLARRSACLLLDAAAAVAIAPAVAQLMAE
jgi:glycerol-3-phosphate dehydrogenase